MKFYKYISSIIFLMLCEISYGVKVKDLKLSECSVEISGGGLGEPQPLFIVPGTSEFVNPDNSNGTLRFNQNQKIEMHCSSNFSSPIEGEAYHMPHCINGTTFHLNGTEFEFNEFNCTSYPSHVARRTERACENNNSIIVEIGFVVDSRFFQIMDVCHNEELAHNHYVYFKQTPSNVGTQRNFPRPNWLTGGFYPQMGVDTLYSRNQQEQTFATILRSAEIANDLVQSSPNVFLARGHMAAKSDYIFGSQQRATFYFLNAGPQWQTFNGGNWERVEDGVRQFVAVRNISIDIYTGLYGIMTHPDVDGIPQKLYLSYDIEEKQHKIPVPKIYYKVLYHGETKSGIVLIGVNNPHITLEEIERDYIFCNDVSDQITWLQWVREDLVLGYSYACEVNEFATVVGHLPYLNVTSLLI